MRSSRQLGRFNRAAKEAALTEKANAAYGALMGLSSGPDTGRQRPQNGINPASDLTRAEHLAFDALKDVAKNYLGGTSLEALKQMERSTHQAEKLDRKAGWGPPPSTGGWQ